VDQLPEYQMKRYKYFLRREAQAVKRASNKIENAFPDIYRECKCCHTLMLVYCFKMAPLRSDGFTRTCDDCRAAYKAAGVAIRPGKNRVDRTGTTYGNLTVTKYIGRDKGRNSIYECSCACGAKATVRLNHLTSGHSTSCGCSRKKKRTKK